MQEVGSVVVWLAFVQLVQCRNRREREMKFSVIFLLVLSATSTLAKSVSKKSSSSDSDKEPQPNRQSAIIAIQIVDPEDEKSGGRQSKRTIDNALGYGFQGNHLGVPQAPRYEVYKYSQHDIPPFKSNNFGLGAFKTAGLAGPSNQYLPGTTLFSSIDQNGHIGRLSPNLPNAPQSHSIPVIILKVLPSQLTSNHLYPSLPSSNLFAPIVNSIDIKSLLASYVPSVKGGLIGRLPSSQYTTPQVVVATTPKYTPPPPSKAVYEYQAQQQTKQQYLPQKRYYQQQQEQYYQPQKQSYHYQTQQVQYQQAPESYQEEEEVDYQPQQEQYQSQAEEEYEPQVSYQHQAIEPRQPHVQYQAQQQQQDYETQQQQYQGYQQTKQDTTVDIVKAKEYVLPTRTYHYPSTSKPVNQELLTYENYPSDTHTRVVFKTNKGNVRTSQKAEQDSSGAYATTPSLNYEKYPSPSLEYDEQGIEDNRYVQYEASQQEDEAPRMNYVYVKSPHQS